MLYSRYHKSQYFCATCHDVSNPVLANLAMTAPTRRRHHDPAHRAVAAHSYFHVERTFSEFMLSDYGLQGGAAGLGPFDPSLFETSMPSNFIAKCQDCHMRDGVGKAAEQEGTVLGPTSSSEHPESGLPLHDMTGGNAWVPGCWRARCPARRTTTRPTRPCCTRDRRP